MIWRRVQQYAAAHARLRARLGLMPDAVRWRYIAGATDLDAAIQRMRDNGLGRWLQGLSRDPDISTIEQALTRGLHEVVRDVASWLPKSWQGVRRWLHDGLTLIYIRRLLRHTSVVLPVGIDPVLGDIAQSALERRSQVLAATHYSRYLSTEGFEWDHWFGYFQTLRPPTRGREAYVIDRLQKLLVEHRDAIEHAREQWRRPHDIENLNPDLQWRLREELGDKIFDLLSGESFHAGAILIYGVLELLQFERARALLTARYYGWEHARIT